MQPDGGMRGFPNMAEKHAIRRALVVDDEPLIRWSIAETLHELGLDVEQAATGAAAVDCAAGSEPFEIVFLDFRLPDSNDLQLLARLRALLPASPIVMMTAFGTPETVRGALDLGALKVLSKPFEMSEIASLIGRAH